MQRCFLAVLRAMVAVISVAAALLAIPLSSSAGAAAAVVSVEVV